MTWAKVDDRLYDDPRFDAAGLEAMGLFLAALSYMGAYLTDGEIGEERVRRIAGRRGPALTEKLIAAGWWERVEGGKVRLISWDTYLLSRADVEAERARKSDAGRLGATRTNAKRLESGSAGAAAGAVGASGASRARDPDPVPSRPVPKEREQALSPASEQAFKLETQDPKAAKRDRKKPEKPLPDGWQPTAQAFEVGRTCGLDGVRVRFEADRFRDHARANDRRCVEWNAAFGNWLRGAKPGPAPASFKPAEPPRPGPKPPPKLPLPDVPWVDGKPQFSPVRPKPPREPDPNDLPETEEERAEREELNRQKWERVARERAERAAEGSAGAAS